MMARLGLAMLISLLASVFAGGALAAADMSPTKAHYCLDTAPVHSEDTPSSASPGGVSLRGLLATAGIGLLSLLFLLPIAWLCEQLMQRGRPAGKSIQTARVG
ncbi:hypothetical protein F0M18_02785 [Pseudohalioglobus sediminis]|uniref:Uncharacterized protein n=1 Tax=Pseudohalioglobus sediminis TaxID=2606449 RepID=A0A5B0X556_9GAMM|nr:hypothetical protein [Pseudohalioglobus sediminis]KAA1194373.1 hypothetical protein F0M18_02785 [Pseudohalioglobus sediminis]